MSWVHAPPGRHIGGGRGVNFFDNQDVQRWFPGVIGAFVAMLMAKEVWRRRLVMFLGGSAFSIFAMADAVRITGLNTGLAGFLLGLFGMSIISSIYQGWERLDMGDILRDAVRQLLRLPPVPAQPPADSKKED